MDNTVTISINRYEQLLKSEFALRILIENRYSTGQEAVHAAVARTMEKEEQTC